MEQHSNDQQTGLWARLKERAAAWNDPEARQQRGRRAGQRRRLARDWARIHLRRAAHRTHGTLAIQQAVGPASFLVVSAALGVAGMSCLWSILELKEQEKRVARGWFPKKERKKST